MLLAAVSVAVLMFVTWLVSVAVRDASLVVVFGLQGVLAWTVWWGLFLVAAETGPDQCAAPVYGHLVPVARGPGVADPGGPPVEEVEPSGSGVGIELVGAVLLAS